MNNRSNNGNRTGYGGSYGGYRSDRNRSGSRDNERDRNNGHNNRYGSRDRNNRDRGNNYDSKQRSGSRDSDKGGNRYSNNRNGDNQERSNTRDYKKQRYRETNQQLIKYIYSTIDISQFKYDLLKYDHQLSKFISGVYYVSPNFHGKNCFLVFTKIKSRYYSFLVDRRQLSYTLDKVRFDNVFIHHCNIDIDLSIYAGTIFDGIYIRKGNSHEFIITDVYCFKGTDYTGNKLKHKLFEIKMYLDNIGTQMKYNKDKINARTNLELHVNDLYEINDVRKFMDRDIKNYSDYQVRGVCFYPEISGTKLIHLFGNEDRIDRDDRSDTRRDKNSDNNDSDNTSTNKRYTNDITQLRRSKRLVKQVYVAKTSEPIYAILEMKATKTVDNYKMYAVDKVKKGGAVKLKKCQMDIAYIGSIDKSKWCRTIINNSQKGSVFVKCVWRDNVRKWEPLELEENVKFPSLMVDIMENIIEMEESDSDTDGE